MFRSRFNDAFTKSLAHFGPQDIERDVVQTVPGDRVENFLCAILGLLLNRKQDVKYALFIRTRQKQRRNAKLWILQARALWQGSGGRDCFP